MSRYNNFLLYFPGKLYRTIPLEDNLRKCADLDKILAELHFDMGEFNRINAIQLTRLERTVTLYKSSRAENRPLSPEEENEIDQLSAQGDIDEQLLDELLEPAYTAMRKLGYSMEDLWR